MKLEKNVPGYIEKSRNSESTGSSNGNIYSPLLFKSKLEDIGELVDSILLNRLETFLTQLRGFDKICIFGAGRIAFELIAFLKDNKIKVDFICDNDSLKWNKSFQGIECISPLELHKLDGCNIAIILTMQYYTAVYEELKQHFSEIFIFDYFKMDAIALFKNSANLRIIKDKLQQVISSCSDEISKYIVYEILNNLSRFYYNEISFPNLCESNQYFPKDIITLNDNECFVDAGGYDGDTIFDFFKETNNNFKKIYSFELAKQNYEKIQMNMTKIPNNIKNKISIYNMGLSDKEGIFKYEFNENQSYGAKISNNSEYIAEVTSLDKILPSSEKVTFIKMDIEGSELNALKGAKKIITAQKPKLAICIYHERDDLWEIPLFIKSLVPEYKIFIRHHSILSVETVCYAI